MTEDASTGILLREMARRLDEVATRMEAGLGRMDANYVRRDVFELSIKAITDAAAALTAKVEASDETLNRRISDLEDDKKYLIRTVLGFIIVGVLSAVFVASQVGGP